MTVNTTKITGFVVLPNDTVRDRSKVIFTMTGFDTDADDNAVVVPVPIEASIADDASIDIDMWPNPEGVRTTFYRVTFSIYNGVKPILVDAGLISVPVSGGPYDLNDLLPIAPPQGATVEEYIAQLAAAVASAEDAATRAEDAAATINALEVADDGVQVLTPATTLNFTGSGVSVTQDGTDPIQANINIPGGGAIVYDDIVAFRAALDADTLADGTRVFVHGVEFEVDSALDGSIESWFYNTRKEINHGVRLITAWPWNLHDYVSFLDQNTNKIYQHVSADGLNWNAMNWNEMPRGKANNTVGGRDPRIQWVPERGEWLMFITSGEGQPHDYTYYRSKDRITWSNAIPGFIGTNPSGIRGTILPGGVNPADLVWGVKLEKYDGQWYLLFNAEYGPDFVNVHGNTQEHHFPFYAVVNDVFTMSSDDPVAFDVTSVGFPDKTVKENSSLTPSIIHHPDDGLYYMLLKNSWERNIDIYYSATLGGTWTFGQTLDQDGSPTIYDSLEGPLWQVHRYIDPSTDELVVKHRVMVSDNRDENDELVGNYRYFESDNGPNGTYDPDELLRFSLATRNGGVLNLAMLDDPRAMQSVLNAITAFGGHVHTRMRDFKSLNTPTDELFPDPDYEYFVDGVGNSSALTINGRGSGDRFWLSVLSDDAGTGISVQASALMDAFTVGYGKYETVEVRWSVKLGKYIPIGIRDTTGGGGSLSFSNNGTPVDGGSATDTLDVISDGPAEVTGTGTTKQLRVRGPDWGTSVGEYLMKDSAGTNRWGFNTDGTFRPINGAYDIGTYTDPWAGYLFNGQSVDGLSDGNNIYRQIITNSGIPKLQKSTTTGHNEGMDMASRVNILDLGSGFSGTHTFDPDEGSYIFATLGGAATFNLSALRDGEVLNMTIRALNSQTIAFTLPGGKTMRWVGGTDYGGSGGATIAAGTFWTNTDFSVLAIPGAVHIVAAEAVNAS